MDVTIVSRIYLYVFGSIGVDSVFNNLLGIAISSTGSFAVVSDYGNNVIRLLHLLADGSSIASTIAGSGDIAYMDGVGTNAAIAGPAGLALSFDDEYIYVIAALNNVIRKIEISTELVSTAVGSGEVRFVDGDQYEAGFGDPIGICMSRKDSEIAFILDSVYLRLISFYKAESQPTWSKIFPVPVLVFDTFNKLLIYLI